ncbi:MAG: hypothetical protein ACTTJ7_05365 [Treponema sp.]
MFGKILYFISISFLLIFMGANLNNRCDISLVIRVFKDVPIFLSMMLSFLLGNIAMIPFLIGSRNKIRKAEKQATAYPAVKTVELKTPKRSWFGRKKTEANFANALQEADEPTQQNTVDQSTVQHV